MEKNFQKIKELLAASERVLILLHKYPDGDTIASSLALATYLKSQGKRADCASSDLIPEAFSFLPASSQIKTDFLLGDYDLIVAVDCGDAQRTGIPLRLEQITSKNKPFINIDHHLNNNLSRIADAEAVDTKASATAEIIWELFDYLGVTIDSRLATYILVGIYFDTGGFQHSNVRERTLEIASECLRLGGRIALVSQNINGVKNTPALRILGLALQRISFKPNGIVTSILTQADMKESGAELEDASGIVNLINSVPDSKAAILFVETPDGKIKASLRTEKDDINVADLARLFGGGGHKKASGFTFDGKLTKNSTGWSVL